MYSPAGQPRNASPCSRFSFELSEIPQRPDARGYLRDVLARMPMILGAEIPRIIILQSRFPSRPQGSVPSLIADCLARGRKFREMLPSSGSRDLTASLRSRSNRTEMRRVFVYPDDAEIVISRDGPLPRSLGDHSLAGMTRGQTDLRGGSAHGIPFCGRDHKSRYSENFCPVVIDLPSHRMPGATLPISCLSCAPTASNVGHPRANPSNSQVPGEKEDRLKSASISNQLRAELTLREGMLIRSVRLPPRTLSL